MNPLSEPQSPDDIHGLQSENRQLQDSSACDMPRASVFASAFLAAPYPAVVLDGAGLVVACNRRAAQMWWKQASPDPEQLTGTEFCIVADLSRQEMVHHLHVGMANGHMTLPLVHVDRPLQNGGARLRVCMLGAREPGQYLALVTQDVLRSSAKVVSMINQQKQAVAKKAEELSSRSQHLEQVLASTRVFTNAASHDLRGPLGNLKNLLALFSDRYAAGLPDKGRNYLDMMKTAAEDLQDLTLCLLDYASAASGKIAFHRVEIRSVLQAVRHSLAPQLNACGGTFDIEACSAEVLAEPLLLRTLLTNLCGNAIKFRAPGRPLQISATAGFFEPGWFDLSIRDNGKGFSASEADRIFEPFERLHSDVDGSGIGLATVKEICHRHGWSILANGVAGEGAEFVLRIPLDRPQA